jgi:hypothetical protein
MAKISLITRTCVEGLIQGTVGVRRSFKKIISGGKFSTSLSFRDSKLEKRDRGKKKKLATEPPDFTRK